MIRTRRFVFSSLASALIASGCAGSLPSLETPEAPLTASRLYPAELNNVWSYNVTTDVDDPPILSITRVTSVTDNHFEISSNNSAPVVYEHRPGGIYRVSSDSWLIREPLVPGQTWSAGERTARIVSVDVRIETDAQVFEGCVRIEESGEDERTIATVYCPDVGPVWIESTMTSMLGGRDAFVRASLLGFAVQ